MSYSFEGNLRRRPEQNLSGSSKKQTREALIQRAHEERLKRQSERLRVKSAQTIQSYARSYLTRKHAKEEQRKLFDQDNEEKTIDSQLARLLFFYHPNADIVRMENICMSLIPLKEIILSRMSTDVKFMWLIKRLLGKCLVLMSHEEKLLLGAEMLNNFSNSPEIQHYLISTTGYYKTLSILFEKTTIPELLQSLLKLIEQPFIFIPPSNNEAMITSMTSEFVQYFMSQNVTLKIKNILIPYLSTSGTFPYQHFVKYISAQTSTYDAYMNNILYCMLSLEKTDHICKENIQLLSQLTLNLYQLQDADYMNSRDDDSDDECMDVTTGCFAISEYLALFNKSERVCGLINFCVWNTDDGELMGYMTRLCHNLLLIYKDSIRKFMLVYLLAQEAIFLRELWLSIKRNEKNIFDSGTTNMSTANKWKESQIPVSVFCDLFTFYTEKLTDSGAKDTSETFSNEELAEISEMLKQVAISLIDVAYPMCRTPNSVVITHETLHFYYSALRAVKKLHMLDIRKKFCEKNFWTKRKVHVSPDLAKKNYLMKTLRPFYGVVPNDDDSENLPPLSTIEQRSLAILQELPFLLEFNQRVMILRQLCYFGFGNVEARLRSEFTSDLPITVRRAYLYEDAFDKLSQRNDDDLRHKLRIQFINNVGLEEAGIDGGGIFKEFINEVLKTAFDPNRGFFLLTGDNTLYPNPQVHLLFDNYIEHYYFIGRLVGKALYENILVDLPLAEFFLAKLLVDRASAHYLESLDPVLYRNLLYLRDFKGDVQELGLDFTLVHNDLGETRVYELKPNGSNIPVTDFNRLEYIRLLADLKLNSQLKEQCGAFREGLNSVVPLLWLKLFNHNELQVMISGDTQEIDIEDMKTHTVYGGEYNTEHPTIVMFWNVVKTFTDVQKKMLLKFVTSCSRPPLLGFKELNPSFGIQSSGSEDRMPTASTCLNLLKLPVINDEETLTRKLLSAIEQQAGFELS